MAKNKYEHRKNMERYKFPNKSMLSWQRDNAQTVFSNWSNLFWSSKVSNTSKELKGTISYHQIIGVVKRNYMFDNDDSCFYGCFVLF